jgi:hypothetical protein
MALKLPHAPPRSPKSARPVLLVVRRQQRQRWFMRRPRDASIVGRGAWNRADSCARPRNNETPENRGKFRGTATGIRTRVSAVRERLSVAGGSQKCRICRTYPETGVLQECPRGSADVRVRYARGGETPRCIGRIIRHCSRRRAGTSTVDSHGPWRASLAAGWHDRPPQRLWHPRRSQAVRSD